ncbi:MAG TPA: hypothetical protein VFV52_00305 [Bacilli bacterium]|nr:hypothetical protein [Bacilli bacterium]
MTDAIMSWLDQGVSLLLQVAVLVGLFLLRTIRNKVSEYVESRTTLHQRELLAQIGREAYAYAETVYREADGPAKLNHAIRYLLDHCERCELTDVKLKEARAVIESAWLKDNTSNKTAEPVQPPASYSEEKR